MTTTHQTNTHIRIDDEMTWPLPNGDLEWRLRYGKPTRQDILVAASIIHSYGSLVKHPIKRRDYIVRHLKEATNGLL